MDKFEYKAVPAPQYGKRTKGARSHEARYAQSLGDVLNEMSREGWEYLRADQLPSTDRKGLFRRKVENTHSMLIFRRPASKEFLKAPVAAPKKTLRVSAPSINLGKLKKPNKAKSQTSQTTPNDGQGVEETSNAKA